MSSRLSTNGKNSRHETKSFPMYTTRVTNSGVSYLQKADTLTVSVFARLFLVLITPIANSFCSSCSVIFIRNSSLASSVC